MSYDFTRVVSGGIEWYADYGATSATDHLIVKAILGRRFDWGRHSPID